MKVSNLFLSGLILLTLSCNTSENKSEKPAAANDAAQKKNIAPLTINGNMENGSKLFKKNCGTCHTLSDKKLIGPGLKDVFARIPQPAEVWMKKYIYNSAAIISSGDAYAGDLFRNNNGTAMPPFENVLAEQDVNDIIYFLYNDKNSN